MQANQKWMINKQPIQNENSCDRAKLHLLLIILRKQEFFADYTPYHHPEAVCGLWSDLARRFQSLDPKNISRRKCLVNIDIKENPAQMNRLQQGIHQMRDYRKSTNLLWVFHFAINTNWQDLSVSVQSTS